MIHKMMPASQEILGKIKKLSCGEVCKKNALQAVGARKIKLGKKLVSSPITDVFISKPSAQKRAVQKFSDFTIEEHFYKKYSDFAQNHQKASSARHTKRMQLFALDVERAKPRAVSKKQITAMNMIQYELDEYTNVMAKLRSGGKLNPKEQEFFDFIVSAMEKTKEPQILWRSVSPYDGFAEQIQSGILDMGGFSSAAKSYSDFFQFWESPSHKKVGEQISFKEPYMLKINVKKGTPILDCNATYRPLFGKTKYTRMADEVILPHGKGIVKSIDKDLRIIEVDFCPN